MTYLQNVKVQAEVLINQLQGAVRDGNDEMLVQNFGIENTMYQVWPINFWPSAKHKQDMLQENINYNK